MGESCEWDSDIPPPKRYIRQIYFDGKTRATLLLPRETMIAWKNLSEPYEGDK